MSQVSDARFEPLHSAHAIENVQFILNLRDAVSESQWHLVLAALKTHAVDLPGEDAIMSVAASAGAVEGRPGIARRRVAPNGAIEEELAVTRGTLLYRTSKYTRWEACWKRAKFLFDSILATFPEGVILSSVGQSVVDKFVCDGDPTPEKLLALLRLNSPFICQHVFDQNDLWHSHIGAFSQHDDYTRRLQNINLDYLDDSSTGVSKRTLAVTIVVSDQFQQDGYKPLTTQVTGTQDIIEEHMQSLHQANKTILSKIISDEMGSRIALSYPQ